MTVAARMPARGAGRARQVAARLGFAAVGGRTHLAAQHTPHPFHITRAFHLAGDPEGMATLYLQSSSGGLYGDDDLTLEIAAGPGARAHVTSQASTVVHHARGAGARQRVRIAAAADALLEFCPDPLILFAGARLSAGVTARLEPGARLILTDAALTHDPQGGGAAFERFDNLLCIEDGAGRALMVERQSVTGAEWLARTEGRPCHAMVAVAGAPQAEAVAAAMAAGLDALAGSGLHAGTTAFAARGIAIARCLAPDGAVLSAALAAGWAAARAALSGAAPPPRRK